MRRTMRDPYGGSGPGGCAVVEGPGCLRTARVLTFAKVGWNLGELWVHTRSEVGAHLGLFLVLGVIPNKVQE